MLVPHALLESLVVEPARLSRPLSGDQRILQRLNLGLVFFQAAQDMITTGIELPAILTCRKPLQLLTQARALLNSSVIYSPRV